MRVRVSEVAWSDERIKLCLYLYLGLLPVNHRLIHDLANVYTSAVADIKRTILRVLEAPVCFHAARLISAPPGEMISFV